MAFQPEWLTGWLGESHEVSDESWNETQIQNVVLNSGMNERSGYQFGPADDTLFLARYAFSLDSLMLEGSVSGHPYRWRLLLSDRDGQDEQTRGCDVPQNKRLPVVIKGDGVEADRSGRASSGEGYVRKDTVSFANGFSGDR